MDHRESRHDRPSRPPSGLFALVNGFLSIGLMAMAALVTRQPLVFPSLGPTAFLLFSTPHLPTASPRNTLCGHFIGIVTGYLSLVVFSLRDIEPTLEEGVT
ncbi:MAG TPA: HPP family protein, partial [Mycobacteriales bacterium]